MITLEELGVANAKRQELWGGADKIDVTFIGLEIGEEAGEVQGALKKIIRHDLGVVGNKGKSREELEAKLKAEIGDVLINLSRLCNALNLNPSECIRKAFNDKSDDLGIDVHI